MLPTVICTGRFIGRNQPSLSSKCYFRDCSYPRLEIMKQNILFFHAHRKRSRIFFPGTNANRRLRDRRMVSMGRRSVGHKQNRHQLAVNRHKTQAKWKASAWGRRTSHKRALVNSEQSKEIKSDLSETTSSEGIILGKHWVDSCGWVRLPAKQIFFA